MRELKTILVSEIEIDPIANMRKGYVLDFKDKEVQNLIESIKRKGVASPIFIRDRNDGSGGFWTFGGSRRILIAKYLKHEKIPCLYYGSISDREAKEISWCENIHQHVSLHQKIMHFKSMISDLNSERVGDIKKYLGSNGNNGSQSTIHKYAYIISLPDDVLTLSKTRKELNGSDREKIKFYTSSLPSPFSGRSCLSFNILYRLGKLRFTGDVVSQLAHFVLGKKHVEVENFIDYCDENRYKILSGNMSIRESFEKYNEERNEVYSNRLKMIDVHCDLSELSEDKLERLKYYAYLNHKKLDRFVREITENGIRTIFLSEIEEYLRHNS